MKRAANIFLALAAVSTLACREYQKLHRQLPTFANLQAAAFTIDDMAREQGSVSEDEVKHILETWNDGRDAWGNRVVFIARNEPSFSFLLLSLGSDGEPDVDDLSVYFDLKPENIVGSFERDIVFRGREPVTIASNK